MSVTSTYLPGEYGKAARRWGDQALSGLGMDSSYDLEIRGVGDLPPGAVGRADSECVCLAKEAFTNGRTTKQRDDYLGFVIYEEVAHHVLQREGVPGGESGPLAALIQETFATWYQMQAKLVPVAYISYPPIPARDGLYEVGNYVGASLAGLAAAKTRLRVWLGDPEVHVSEKQLVKQLQRRLSAPLTVEAMAALYDELKGEHA